MMGTSNISYENEEPCIAVSHGKMMGTSNTLRASQVLR